MSADDIFKYFFYNLPRKIGFKILCKFPWNVNAYFLGKIKKNISNLSSVEFIQKVVYYIVGSQFLLIISFIEIHIVNLNLVAFYGVWFG